MDKKHVLKVAKFLVRWGIAVVGIWWVISKMSWKDHVLALLPGQSMPVKNVVLASDHATDQDEFYPVIDPRTGATITLSREQVINEPDRPNLTVFENGKLKYVVGVDLGPDLKKASRLLVADHPAGPTATWEPASDFPDYQVTVPHPRVQIGVLRMIRQANIHYLFAALAIFPLTILITSFRWHELLKAVEIRLTLERTFVLNMVGLFYNTIMPTGSTGGDVFKAYYVARQTHHRTRAVM
jgi:hypothetical protein